MSKYRKEKQNYWKAANSLLIVFPEILEKYICTKYPDGILSAILEKEDEFYAKLSENQQNLVDTLIETSKYDFYSNYDAIVENTVLDKEVLDNLISQCVLTTEDRQEVESYARQSDRNKAVLDLLMGRPYDTFNSFVKAFLESNDNDPEFVENLNSDDVQKSSQKKLPFEIGEHTVRLQKNYHRLIQNLVSTERITDKLVEDEMLAIEDAMEIAAAKTSAEQNRKLIAKIRQKEVYFKFIAALKEDNVDVALAREIETTTVTLEELKNLKLACKNKKTALELGLDIMVILVSVIYEISLPILIPSKEDISTGADLRRLQIFFSRLMQTDKMEDQCLQEMTLALSEISMRLIGTGLENDGFHKWSKPSQTLKTMVSRLKDISKSEDNIPSNVREQITEELELWMTKDKQFVETRSSDFVLRSIRNNSCVTVTASSGVGKTATIRHTAIILQNDGYNVIPISTPLEIKNYYKIGKPTVYVIDDVCGKYTANQQRVEGWKQMIDTVNQIINDKCCKIIVGSRLQVYKDVAFNCLPPFKLYECNIMSHDVCLTVNEKNAIAEVYIGEKLKEFNEMSHEIECFPLLCSLYDCKKDGDISTFFRNPFLVYRNELNKLFESYDKRCRLKITALALCIICNNNMSENSLMDRKVIDDVCDASGVNRGTSKLVLKSAIESLIGTYLVSTRGIYHTKHDKIFDFLSNYYGEKMLECLIRYADIDFISERITWNSSSDGVDVEFIIPLPDSFLSIYFDRLILECLIEKTCYVFANNNFQNQIFRQKFLAKLSLLDDSKIYAILNQTIYLPNDSDDDDDDSQNDENADDITELSPFLTICFMGYLDILQWMLDFHKRIGQNQSLGLTSIEEPTKDLFSLFEKNMVVSGSVLEPLHIASLFGQLEVVCKLIEWSQCQCKYWIRMHSSINGVQ